MRWRDAGRRRPGRAARSAAVSGPAARHHSIAVSKDAVLIVLHPLQRKTRSAGLIEIAGSSPMTFIGKPQSHLGGGAGGGR